MRTIGLSIILLIISTTISFGQNDSLILSEIQKVNIELTNIQEEIKVNRDSTQSIIEKTNQIETILKKQEDTWKYLIPIIVALIAAGLTFLGNLLAKGIEQKKQNKIQNSERLRILISDFLSECYTISGQIITSKQMYKAHPEKVDILVEYKSLFENNKKAYVLLNQIKLLLNPATDTDHKDLNDKLEDYIDKTIVKLTGDETKVELETKLDDILELNGKIIEKSRTILKKSH